MGISALENGLSSNLLIFDYLYVFRYFCKGKGKEKEREKEREKGNCLVGVFSASEAPITCHLKDLLSKTKTNA